MPSQLLTNEHISFVVSKPFVSREKTYEVGDDFPQEDARDIETFVRARYVIPVIDDLANKPKAWHRELRLKEEVLEKLQRDRVQLRMPHEYDSDDEVNLELLTHPELTPATEGSVGVGEDEPDEEPEEEPEPAAEAVEAPVPAANEFDPSEHTVTEVQEYIAAHPDDEERVLQLEAADRARKGIVGE